MNAFLRKYDIDQFVQIFCVQFITSRQKCQQSMYIGELKNIFWKWLVNFDQSLIPRGRVRVLFFAYQSRQIPWEENNFFFLILT